jgi:hypothetical protein
MCSSQNFDTVLGAMSPANIGKLVEELPKLSFFSHIPVDALFHMLPNIVYVSTLLIQRPVPRFAGFMYSQVV